MSKQAYAAVSRGQLASPLPRAGDSDSVNIPEIAMPVHTASVNSSFAEAAAKAGASFPVRTGLKILRSFKPNPLRIAFRICRYSTICRSSPMRTPFTSTLLLLIRSWVVILSSTNDRIESIGQINSMVSFFSAPRRFSTEK